MLLTMPLQFDPSHTQPSACPAGQTLDAHARAKHDIGVACCDEQLPLTETDPRGLNA